MTKVLGTKNPKKKKDEVPAIVDEMAGQLLPGWKQFRKHVLIPVLSGRQERWIKSAYEFLKKSEEKSGQFKVEELFKDEAFVTAFMRASQAAMRDHRKEKHKALQNALLNSALPNSPEEDKRDIFFGLIDDFTPSHLKLLSIYGEVKEGDPSGKRQRFVVESLMTIFADFEEIRPMYVLILDELESRGLVKKEYSGANPDVIEYYFPAIISHMGREFLYFTSSPFGDE